MDWFIRYRRNLVRHHLLTLRPSHAGESAHKSRLLSLVTRSQLIKIMQRMLDEKQFLSPYGIRSLSKEYEEAPFTFTTCTELFVPVYSGVTDFLVVELICGDDCSKWIRCHVEV